MDSPRIQIQRTDPRLQVERKKGYFKVNRSKSRLQIRYQNESSIPDGGRLKINNPPAKLEIDQSKSFADLGSRKFSLFIKHLEQLAANEGQKRIAEIVREGDFLSKIEKKSHTIAEAAKKESYDDQKKLGIRAIPEARQEIKVDPGQIKIKAQPTEVKMQAELKPMQVRAKADKIRFYTEPKARLEIEIVGARVDYNA